MGLNVFKYQEVACILSQGSIQGGEEGWDLPRMHAKPMSSPPNKVGLTNKHNDIAIKENTYAISPVLDFFF